MFPRDLMLQPAGSHFVVDCPDDRFIRFPHWLGYHAERIDGTRQTLIKTLAPGSHFHAPPTEQAAYLAIAGSAPGTRRVPSRLAGVMAILTTIVAALLLARA